MGKNSKNRKEAYKRQRSDTSTDSSPGTLSGTAKKMAAALSEVYNTGPSVTSTPHSQQQIQQAYVQTPFNEQSLLNYHLPPLNYAPVSNGPFPLQGTFPTQNPGQTAQTPTVSTQVHVPIQQGHDTPSQHGSPFLSNTSAQPPDYIIAMSKKLDFVVNKMAAMETLEQNIRGLQGEIKEIKESQHKLEHSIQFLSENHDTHAATSEKLSDNVKGLERHIKELSTENSVLKEHVIDLQCRSMRDNLVFSGINETESNGSETESVLKQFLRREMEITDDIGFERVHRLGRKNLNTQSVRPRPIVAKFSRYKDREAVRFAASNALKGKPYGVNEQYPKEVMNRRSILLPAFKKARRDPSNNAKLIVDKLFIKGQQMTPEEAIAYANTQEARRAKPVPNVDTHSSNRPLNSSASPPVRTHNSFAALNTDSMPASTSMTDAS